MLIEISLNELYKSQAEGKSSGRPGLVKKKVTVKRGGKTFQQYRWVKAGDEEPTEKKPVVELVAEPKKELVITGLNKPEPKKEKSKSELIAEIELLMERKRKSTESLLQSKDEIRRQDSLKAISDMDLKIGDTVNYSDHSYPVEGIGEDGVVALGGAGYSSAWAQYLEKPSKGEELPPHPPDKPEAKKGIDIEKARTNMLKYINKADKKELGAVALYTNIDNPTSNFDVVNKYIRTGEVEPDNKKNVEMLINQVSDFLKDAPKVKGTVYRGMMWEKGGEGSKEFEGFLKQMEEGGYVEMNPFTSTSTKRQIVENLFVGSQRSDHTIRFEIKSKSGVFLGDLSAESEESEVLFDKDTKFKIKKVDRSEYPGSVEIVMEEI